MKYLKIYENFNPNQEALLVVAMKKALQTYDRKAFDVIVEKGFNLKKYKDELINYCKDIFNYNIISWLDREYRDFLIEDTFDLIYSEVEKIENLKGLFCMKNLESISVNGAGLKSLKGIEYLRKLEDLDCSKNEITSLEPLKRLKKLRSLDCDSNKIEDISPLQYCEDLYELRIGNNLISTLKPIMDLPMEELHYGGNPNLPDRVYDCLDMMGADGECLLQYYKDNN